METSRGGLKLVDGFNYIYEIDRKYGEKTYWKCDSVGCKARVHTELEGDSVSVCKTVGEHYHPSKPKVYEAKTKMKSIATNSQTSARSLIAEVAFSLDSNTLALLPTKAHLQISWQNWFC